MEEVVREVSKSSLQRQIGTKVVHYLKTTTIRQRRDVAPYMFVEGYADLGNHKALLNHVLMDSGALHGSYISNTWFEQNREHINPTCVKAVDGTVVMGDDATTQRINTMVVLTVIVKAPKGKLVPFTAAFSVIEMKHHMIIGLPDLVTSLPVFFISRFRAAAGRSAELLSSLTYDHKGIRANRPAHLGRAVTERHFSRVASLASTYAEDRPSGDSSFKPSDFSAYQALEPLDIVEPWAERDIVAHEELDQNLPVLFGDSLNFMEMSEADARQAYLRTLDPPPPMPGERIRFHPDLLKSDRFQSHMRNVSIDTFVPTNWDGINTSDVHIDFDPAMPTSRKIPCRPIPHRRVEPVTKEIKRLCSYHLTPSTSSIVSGLVVADKATEPFVRLCGDYRWVNTFVLLQHGWIPVVQDALARLKGFRYYVDLDLSNAFHQLRIDFETSEKLALLTPHGTLRPRFLPEGVAPASAILQTKMMELFEGFEDWLLVIFDNCVIGANDLDQLMDRYELFIQRCQEKNIFLKLSKSYFGVTEVHFFGYVVDKDGFRFDAERLQGLSKYAFPTTGTPAQRKTAMQQFLGAANFFRPAYVYASGPKSSTSDRTQLWADLTGPLYETTTLKFNWDPSSYTSDYQQHFNRLQQMLLDASRIFFPDYSLPWVLRTDASILGIGAILYQVRASKIPNEGGVGDIPAEIYEPICTLSHKFSDPATRWATIKQEAYAIYFAIKKFSHLLLGKEFLCETDHANLLFLEKSEVPILTRWRLYMQTFRFQVRHIPGVLNIVADSLSRIPASSEDLPEEYELNSYPAEEMLHFEQVYLQHDLCAVQALADDFQDEPQPLPDVSKSDLAREYPESVPQWDDIIRNVHGGVNLHFGVDITWKRLNKLFSGHGVPVSYIGHFIQHCGSCQKLMRDYKDNAIEPVIRHLRPPRPRETVGIDMIHMSPDTNGNQYAHVLVNHFSKFVLIVATKTADAIDAARAILKYKSTIGPVRVLMSDPGSNYTSQVVLELNKMLGIAHRVSLVDRHESNGVEPVNQQIKRHVQAIIQDERFTDRWSSSEVIDLVQHELNNLPRLQTGGYTSMQLNTGELDTDETYDIKLEPPVTYTAFTKRLAKDLETIRAASRIYQDKHAARAEATEANANHYQSGDLVLLRNEKPESKDQAKWLGPFAVVSSHKNDVSVEHLVSKRLRVVHVSLLRVYYGSRLEGIKLAMRDNDEYEVRCIDCYGGDPMKRQTLYFNTIFEDGTESQLLHDNVKDTEALKEFVRLNKELRPLTFRTHALALEDVRKINAKKLTPEHQALVGSTVFIDIRSREHFGVDWYEALQLVDKLRTLHVMPFKVTKLETKGTALELQALFPDVSPTRKHFLRLKHHGVLTQLYTETELMDRTHIILPSHDTSALSALLDTDSQVERVSSKDEIEERVDDKDSDSDISHEPTNGPVHAITIFCLNVNGLASALSKGLLPAIPSVDHICLQETKISSASRLKYVKIFKAAGYRVPHFSCHESKGYAGVAIFSKSKPTDSTEEVCTSAEIRLLSHQAQGRLLTLVYTSYILVTAYVPFPRMDGSKVTETIVWRRMLSRHLAALEERYARRPIILAGDLNGIMSDLDATPGVRKGVCATPDERTSMMSLLHNGIDAYRTLYPDTPGHTALCSIPSTRGESFRLDYVLASKQCRITQADIISTPTLSDHLPLVVSIDLFTERNGPNINSFGPEYSSDVTGDGPDTPPKGIRRFFVPSMTVDLTDHTSSPVESTTEPTPRLQQAIALDAPFTAPSHIVVAPITREQVELVSDPDPPTLSVPSPNHLQPSVRKRRYWLITAGTNAGAIHNNWSDAAAAALTTDNQSGGNTMGFPNLTLARIYASTFINTPAVPEPNYVVATAELVEEPMNMSNVSEALASVSTSCSNVADHETDSKIPASGDIYPFNSNLTMVHTYDLLAPVLGRYSYVGPQEQLVDVHRSLQSYDDIQPLQLIAIANGQTVPMQHAEDLLYPHNRYLVALSDDWALDCSAYANLPKPGCLFSMANNAIGLTDHLQRRLLTDCDNNAAAWAGTYNGSECVLIYALVPIPAYTDIMWNYRYTPLSRVATPRIGDGLRFLHAAISNLDKRYTEEDASDSASDLGFGDTP